MNNSCLHTEGVAKLKVETTTCIERQKERERERERREESGERGRFYTGNVERNVS